MQRKTVIYLGYCVDAQTAETLPGASVAGNNFQLFLLEGMEQTNRVDLSCFTVYPTASFPRNRQLYFKQALLPLTANTASMRVRFLNLPIVKQMMQGWLLYYQAKKIARTAPDACILSYNMYPQTGLPAWWLRRKFPSLELVPILLDVPVDETHTHGWLRHWMRTWYLRKTEKLLLFADRIIVLNAAAAKKYAPQRSYLLMEGGVPAGLQLPEITPMNNREKVILYSGRLTEYNGVGNLIRAMEQVYDSSFCLHIYGDGPQLAEVKALCTQVPGAEYCGTVSNDQMKRLQQQAWLLVNPRTPDDPISMGSFPSKMFEYLVSGTPVLSVKLNSYTLEYLDKMYLAPSNQPEVLAQAINEVLSLPHEILEETARDAREFVLQEKNWDRQARRVVDFITSSER